MLAKIRLLLYGKNVTFGFDPAATGTGFSDIFREIASEAAL